MSTLISVVEGKMKSYVVRCNAGIDAETGKRKQITKTFSTLEEAEEFVKLIERELRLSYYEVINHSKEAFVGLSFKEFVNDWFYGEYNLFLRPSTFRILPLHFEKQVVQFFGDKIVSDITSEDITKFYLHLKERGYRESTITQIQRLLYTLFQTVVKRGILKDNPIGPIHLKQKYNVRESIMWSEEERNRFLKLAETENNGMIYDFALSSGLRLLELLALTWADIDFDQKQL